LEHVLITRRNISVPWQTNEKVPAGITCKDLSWHYLLDPPERLLRLEPELELDLDTDERLPELTDELLMEEELLLLTELRVGVYDLDRVVVGRV